MESPLLILIFIAFVAIFGYFWSRRNPDAETGISIQAGSIDLHQDAKTAPSQSSELSMLPERFIVLDLETTGLSPDTDEIIEVGAIRVDRDGSNHIAFSTFVKPVKKIPASITEMTGITQGMVDNDGLPLSEAISQFAGFIGDLPLVTFNADFDMAFLLKAAKMQGRTIENRYTCALKLARRAWPGLPSYRLVALAKMGNLPEDDTHRALGDCKRALIVFASAAKNIGGDIRWSTAPLDRRIGVKDAGEEFSRSTVSPDWRTAVKYHAARDANRAFVAETRSLEVSDPAQAVIRYSQAMGRMYEYEKLIEGRWGDDHILDRLTLCLWKLARYQELIDCVSEFAGQFPGVQSTIMAGILKRKSKAESRLVSTTLSTL